MTQLLSGEVVPLTASPQEVWTLLHDAPSLARVLPGCRELSAEGADRYRGLLEARLSFITVRAEVHAALVDPDPPHAVRLELDGHPRGLVGAFRAVIPVRIDRQDDGSRITYGVDLELSGRLASFGAPLLRDVMRRQVVELVRNIEREVASRRETATSS